MLITSTNRNYHRWYNLQNSQPDTCDSVLCVHIVDCALYVALHVCISHVVGVSQGLHASWTFTETLK